MRGLRRPGRRGQAGQSLVEFAAGALVLLLLLVGAAELGRAFYYAVSLQGAAREASRGAAWYSPGNLATPNPDLTDAAILASVNSSLQGSGLVASFRAQPGCLSGSGPHLDPPYDDSAYPAVANSPWVYACYQRKDGGGATGTMTSADPDYIGGEVQVTVLMTYGLITGLFQDQLGTAGIHLVATTHMRIQGSA